MLANRRQCTQRQVGLDDTATRQGQLESHRANVQASFQHILITHAVACHVTGVQQRTQLGKQGPGTVNVGLTDHDLALPAPKRTVDHRSPEYTALGELCAVYTREQKPASEPECHM